jgi:hypothetical protein
LGRFLGNFLGDRLRKLFCRKNFRNHSTTPPGGACITRLKWVYCRQSP